MPLDQPLRGIDYCEHALLAAADGALPHWRTIRSCPICSRRWRIAEARQGGWVPLPRAAAIALFAPMAAALIAGDERANEQAERGFYAYLASAPDDEAEFAAVVAMMRPASLPAIAAPPDFGWRSLFAELADTRQEEGSTTLTRIWQWRTIGTTLAAEGRAFVAGENIPPFGQLPLESPTGRWLREGTDRAAPLLRQILGPLLLTVTADTGERVITLTLRLRDYALADAVPTRVYLDDAGVGEGRARSWHGTLSDEAREQTLHFARADLRAFTIEIDTAW